MPSLQETIKSKAHWLVFALLEGVSLTLLFRYNPYQQSLWFGYATEAKGLVAEVGGQAEYYARLREENRRLTLRNVSLEESLGSLRAEVERLSHEPSYTEQRLAEQTAGMRLIPARICDNSIRQRDNLILINRGSADGVEREQGVICGTGIVGIVAHVSRHYATVVPLLNSKSSISCRLRGSHYFGYLHWEGGNPLVATLDDVPHHAAVKEGDAVETSGFSLIFPEGLFVGRVVKVRDSDDGQALRLSVQLSADISRLNEVMVVANPDKDDILNAAEPPQGKGKKKEKG